MTQGSGGRIQEFVGWHNSAKTADSVVFALPNAKKMNLLVLAAFARFDASVDADFVGDGTASGTDGAADQCALGAAHQAANHRSTYC
jgi:hypothetical protein